MERSICPLGLFLLAFTCWTVATFPDPAVCPTLQAAKDAACHNLGVQHEACVGSKAAHRAAGCADPTLEGQRSVCRFASNPTLQSMSSLKALLESAALYLPTRQRATD